MFLVVGSWFVEHEPAYEDVYEMKDLPDRQVGHVPCLANDTCAYRCLAPCSCTVTQLHVQPQLMIFSRSAMLPHASRLSHAHTNHTSSNDKPCSL